MTKLQLVQPKETKEALSIVCVTVSLTMLHLMMNNSDFNVIEQISPMGMSSINRE
jgi:hypothetical protein